MSIRYKINVIESLKKAGYTTYRIRKDRILNEDVLTRIRKGVIVNISTIDKLCKLLHCQPGDILEYVEDPE